jgi:general secretion pathway protein D
MGGGGGGGGGGGSESGKTVGKVTATADDRTNSVIVVAPDETMKLIDQIIKDLDNDSAVTSVIQTFQLNYADAPSAAKLINSVFQPEQQQGNQQPFNPFRRFQPPNAQETSDTGGKVTAAAADNSNTLVITAPPNTMKIIEDILKKLDEDPAAHSQVTVFQLNYADSASAAKLINSIFTGDSTGTSTPASNNSRGGRGGGGGGGGGGGRFGQPEIQGATTGGSRVVVNAVSDDRTNTVVVTAPSEAMRVVSQILEKLDSNPSAESALFIYHLKNGVAADIQQTLSNLFSTGTNGGGGGSSTNRNAGNTSIGSNQGFGGTGSRGGSSGLGGSSGGLGGSSGSFGQPLTSNTNTQRATGASGTTSQTGASAKATSELVGQVIVVADNDTNSLLVSTASKYREQVMRLIAELDRPVPQVLIKVLVAEVTRDRSNDIGADWNVTGTRASGKGVTASAVMNSLAAQATEGGLVVGLTEDNFSAVLHALSTDGRLDVLSRPYILASDNQLASITIGQEVPFITNTQITDTGQQINTITYQAVGIILNVTPHINPDGAVTLDVAPEISAISATTVPIGNGIQAPVIDNRSAQSRVTVKNGNTVVIGGMMQDQKTVTINKIPLLGDIPYLGAAFSRTQTDRSKTELVIFLTPHVAQAPEVLKGITEDELRHSKTLTGAVDPGVFEQHMKDLKAGETHVIPSTQPTDNVVQIQAPPSTQPFKGVNISGGTETNPETAPRPGSSVPGK